MSLIRAREIIWNDNNDGFKNIWDLLIIVGEENSIVRDMENVIVANKQKLHNMAMYAKRLIDLLIPNFHNN